MHKLVIGNWKMQVTAEESIALASQLQKEIPASLSTTVVVCPSFSALLPVRDILKESAILLGAQDVAWEEKGAFTGEVSVRDVSDAHASFVLLGHSERRIKLGETNEMVTKKFARVIASSMTPVLCIGETAEDRKKGEWKSVLMEQLSAVFGTVKIEREQEVVIAYEPVWAIGTGNTCSVADAKSAIAYIQTVVGNWVSGSWAKKHLRILYGGSVDEKNVREFVCEDGISGVLVGGASIDAKRFAKLVSEVNAVSL